MKHLKQYELTNYKTYRNRNMKYDFHSFLVNDLLSDMGLSIDKPKGESIYNIDADKYLKEIYLNKKVYFKDEVKNIWITDMVNDVTLEYWMERDTIYVLLKIDKYWHRIHGNNFNKVYNYDAENKPEHKKLEMAKTAKQFNI